MLTRPALVLDTNRLVSSFSGPLVPPVENDVMMIHATTASSSRYNMTVLRFLLTVVSKLSRLAAVHGGLEDAQVGQISVLLGKVEAVANDELVGDLESHVLTGYGYPLLALLVEQSHDLE